jgi:hypothetical protein
MNMGNTEEILFLVFIIVIGMIIGVVTIIATTISMSKVKHRINMLQKEVHDLSISLEKSLRSNKVMESEVASPVADNKEPINIKTVVIEADMNSLENIHEDAVEVESVLEDFNEGEKVKTVALKQTENLREFKNIISKTLNTDQAGKTNNGQEKGSSDIRTNETNAINELVRKDSPQYQTLNKPKSNLFTIESIISKLGIFLLLIGFGFIYKLQKPRFSVQFLIFIIINKL